VAGGDGAVAVAVDVSTVGPCALTQCVPFHHQAPSAEYWPCGDGAGDGTGAEVDVGVGTPAAVKL
jgi:hypothetical protein